MIEPIRGFIHEITVVGRDRTPQNLLRRLCKVLEEIGELSEALLNVTCALNYKQKVHRDIREESIDCLIVLLDCALTQLPYSNHTANSMLAQIVEGGIASKPNIDDMEAILFEVAGSVHRAADALKEQDDMSFYGALSTAIRAMSGICLAPMEMTDEHEVEREFYEIVQQKLGKWRGFLASKEKVKVHEAV